MYIYEVNCSDHAKVTSLSVESAETIIIIRNVYNINAAWSPVNTYNCIAYKTKL